jgi:archaellum biogenesis protein FlaJ (TadC family)
MTSHVPGGKDVLWFGFPCFTEIKKSNVSKTYDFQLGKWYHIVKTWDGLNFTVYVNGTELLKTAVPHKITTDMLSRLFSISVAQGMGVDEYTIYDKQLSAEEVKAIYEKYNPNK